MSKIDAGSSPLWSELSAEQTKLLNIILDSILESRHTQEEPQWPVWDYVARSMHMAFPDLEDAAEVFESLPKVGRDPFSDQPYGLAWRTEMSSGPLRPDYVVGLTIAGLHRVEEARFPDSRIRMCEEFLSIITLLAQEESRQYPDAKKVVSEEVPLAKYTEWLRGLQDKRFPVPDVMTIELLKREPARLVFQGEQIRLEGYWLRPFRNVGSVAEYIEVITARARSNERRRVIESPLTLIQTIDYLSLVIAKEKPWTSPTAMVNAPDLQSAASLAAQVGTVDEFTTALIGISNIIDRFEVPKIPVTAAVSEQDRQGTLNRFSFWILSYITEPASKERVQTAIADIRAVLKLRHMGAHPGDDTRKRAAETLRLLDLPVPINDYAEAWHRSRSALSAAFDSIRLEIQNQPPVA